MSKPNRGEVDDGDSEREVDPEREAGCGDGLLYFEGCGGGGGAGCVGWEVG